MHVPPQTPHSSFAGTAYIVNAEVSPSPARARSPDSDLFLGIDFGTDSVRALLVDDHGHIAATAVEPYEHGQITSGSPVADELFADPLPTSFALQDPSDWLASAAIAVRAVSAVAGHDRRVAGIGIDFTGCTMLPALGDGTALVDADAAYRTRPHAWPKLWKHHGAAAQAVRMTAIAQRRGEPWLARYGGVIGLEWLFPKVLEVIEEDPDVAATAEVWLEAGDWVVWQLVGAASFGGDYGVEALVRSTCQAGYKALWSSDGGFPPSGYLHECHPSLADVAEKKLPGRMLAPGQMAGRLSPAAAKCLGLSSGTPISTAIIDAHAGVPGAGVARPGDLVLVLGTSGCHMVMAERELHIPGVAGVVADGILPGYYGYETGQAAVGDAFDWVRRLCGERDHEALEALARRVAPGAEGLLLIDWFNGCRTPLMDGGLTGAILGGDLHHTPAHLYRAALEASACGVRWIVETLRDGGVPIDRVVATGGLPAATASSSRFSRRSWANKSRRTPRRTARRWEQRSSGLSQSGASRTPTKQCPRWPVGTALSRRTRSRHPTPITSRSTPMSIAATDATPTCSSVVRTERPRDRRRAVRTTLRS